jgi:excisionase family DNA binding protein
MQGGKSMGELFTVKEIAEKLKVTERCIYDWIKEGRLKALKIAGIVRIEEEEYLRFIGKDGHEVE